MIWGIINKTGPLYFTISEFVSNSKSYWELFIHTCCTGVVHAVKGISNLDVSSAEHPPAWEQIPLQLVSRVKGM
jgi:hypothetical protein